MAFVFKKTVIETPLGQMLAIADDDALHMLEFLERKELKKGIVRLSERKNAQIVEGTTPAIISIKKELKEYFKGTLRCFQTPVYLHGTPFQNRVWEELQKIPCGETRSYAAIASAIGKPTAYRAVALANSLNQLAIMVPCHRVINSDGGLGGYAAGIQRKEWLLNLEKRLI